jgi:hypothetical protein
MNQLKVSVTILDDGQVLVEPGCDDKTAIAVLQAGVVAMGTEPISTTLDDPELMQVGEFHFAVAEVADLMGLASGTDRTEQ